MGEVPIYTTKAHVFMIDPVTKKSWVPASKNAIPVNFFFDSARNTYRIIGVEGPKAIINSTVLQNMAFTKTSTKFGQWADVRANTVYGLGFSSDTLLNKFAEQFEDIRERAAKLELNDSSPQTNGQVTPRVVEEPRAVNNTTKEKDVLVKEAEDELVSSASDDSRSTNNQNNSEIKHLRMSNDKLKMALAQSSANAKKWETELQALKNTNARLTTALQESMSNVDQWHRQLALYKEENEKHKKKVAELESEVSQTRNLSDQNADLRKQIEYARKDANEKAQECNMLQQRVGVLAVVENQHQELTVRLKQSQNDNKQLKEEIIRLEGRLDESGKAKSKRKLEAQALLGNLADKLTDITEITQKLQGTL
ncbi:homer protein homolog 2-like [Styela clava]|uniref:homer protein homolog 2-like n=1 Tax=Styela clava TaxID=7725 RepID=UPI00193A66E4|nr:homer protein homolog 2-like [Styela clava]